MNCRLFFFMFSLLLIAACDKDDTNFISSSPSFVATVDGDVIQFQNAKVFIKRENGIPFSKEIKGEVISGDTIKRVLNFFYSGNLATANLDSTFIVIMGTYYEDDYSESWSNILGPGEIELSVISYTSTKASGSFTDFTAADNNGDTLTVSDISFGNIPILYADF